MTFLCFQFSRIQTIRNDSQMAENTQERRLLSSRKSIRHVFFYHRGDFKCTEYKVDMMSSDLLSQIYTVS